MFRNKSRGGLTVLPSKVNSLVSFLFLVENLGVNLHFAGLVKEGLLHHALHEGAFDHVFAEDLVHLESLDLLIINSSSKKD